MRCELKKLRAILEELSPTALVFDTVWDRAEKLRLKIGDPLPLAFKEPPTAHEDADRALEEMKKLLSDNSSLLPNGS